MSFALSLGTLAAVQLLAALALQLVVLRIVGAGELSDAFIAAQTLPILLVAALATPLQAVWQPRLAIAASDPGRWRAEQACCQGQVLWLIGGTALAAAAAAPFWLPWLFPGLDSATLPLAVTMTRVMCAGALLNAHALLMAVALRSQERFLLAESIGVAAALSALAAALWWVPSAGVLGAAIISTARAAAVCAVLFVLAGRPLPAVGPSLVDAGAWRRLRPLLLGASIYKLSPLVDRYWGSQAPPGGLTLLSLSHIGMGALAQTLERAVCVPVTPRLARLANARQYSAMRRLLRERIATMTGVAIAVTLCLLALRPVWVELLGRALLLGPHEALQMWWICVLLLGYLHVTASGGLPVAAFVAMGDSLTPVRIGLAGFLLSIPLRSLGFVLAGLPGLALATSLYYLGNLIVLCVVLEKNLEARGAT